MIRIGLLILILLLSGCGESEEIITTTSVEKFIVYEEDEFDDSLPYYLQDFTRVRITCTDTVKQPGDIAWLSIKFLNPSSYFTITKISWKSLDGTTLIVNNRWEAKYTAGKELTDTIFVVIKIRIENNGHEWERFESKIFNLDFR